MRSWIVKTSIILSLSIAASACAHVSPWEREDLARIESDNARHAAARDYEAHFWNVREGMVGGTGAPGGGCGCN